MWQKTSAGVNAVAAINGVPYTASEVKDLRYVQSGNVMFLTHKNHKPMMLRRNSLTSWTLEELPFRGGPWISGEEWASGVKLKMEGSLQTRKITSTGGNVFSSGLIGTLLKVEYAVKAQTFELTSLAAPDKAVCNPFEVKGTMNITTAGEWTGLIEVERSADGGETWTTIRQYRRTNIETQGQWDFTISETEDKVLYRVTAQHNASSSSSGGDITPGGDDYPQNTYPEHPDVDGGENYIYRAQWYTENDFVEVTTYTGKTCYYSPSVHQTFYFVGEDNIGKYGYVVDGYPEGYDENGNYVGG